MTIAAMVHAVQQDRDEGPVAMLYPEFEDKDDDEVKAYTGRITGNL